MYSRKKVSLLLTSAALIFLIHSLLGKVPLFDFFGLISTMPSLPISLFISLALLSIASFILWTYPEKEEKLLALQFFFFVIGLWLAPRLIWGMGIFGGHYPIAWKDIDAVIVTGHFAEGIVYPWPAQWVNYASLTQILGIYKPEALLFWSPFLSQLPIYAFIYLFLKFLTEEESQPNCHWAGIWVSGLGIWGVQTFPVAQGLGILMFYILITLFVQYQVTQGLRKFGFSLSLILSSACIVMAHLLSSLEALGTVIFLFAARRMKSSRIVLFLGVSILSWTIYEATLFFNSIVPSFFQYAFHLEKAAQVEIIEKMTMGSIAHQHIVYAKIITVILFAIIAATGLLLVLGSVFKSRSKSYSEITVLALISGSITPAIIIGAGYGPELMQRLWAFLLPCLAFLGIKLLNSRKTSALLIILLLILIPMVLISGLGPAKYYFLSPSEPAALHFFHEHTPSSYTKISGSWFSGRYCPKERRLDYKALSQEEEKLAYKGSGPLYVVFSEQDKDFYKYERGQEGLQLIEETENRVSQSSDFGLFYAGQKTKLYINE